MESGLTLYRQTGRPGMVVYARVTRNKMKTSIKRRKPLRRRSKRVSDLMAEYRSARAKFIDLNPMCQRCGRYPTDHVHHTHGTAGKLRMAQEHWAALCWECHHWIHLHPVISRKQGWLAPLGKWNKL